MRALLPFLALSLATPCYALAETPAPVPPVAPPHAVAPTTATPTAAVTAVLNQADPILAKLNSIYVKEWNAEPAIVRNTADVGTPKLDLPPFISADILREYKPSSIITKTYSRTQRAVTVYVFTFSDIPRAYGAYSTLRTGSTNIVIRGDMSSESDQYICFLKGTRFVVIYSQVAEDDMSKQAASVVADQLAAGIDEHIESLRFLQSMPFLDRMPGTERILAGPISARKYMPIPFVQMLRIQDARQALAADYQFPHPDADRVKAMLIDYGDKALAFNIFTQYSDRLAESYKSKFMTANMQASKTGDTFMLCGYTGTRVYIAAGAHKKISLSVLGRQFASTPQYPY
jgi:hypothetical protein